MIEEGVRMFRHAQHERIKKTYDLCKPFALLFPPKIYAKAGSLSRSARGIFFSFLFLVIPLQAVVVGSNTSVSRQAYVNFPASDNSSNEIRGFAAMENGFSLENSSAQCIFNSFFSVGGDITLNGGSLSLSQDVILESRVKIVNAGFIIGNQHSLEFTTTSQFSFPSGKAPKGFELLDEVIVSDEVNSVDWSYDSSYVVIGLDNNEGVNLLVYSFDGLSLTLEVSVAVPEKVNSVRWHPSSYYLAVVIDDEVDDIILYQFNNSAKTLIKADGGFLTGDGKAVAWQPNGNHIACSSTNTSKEIHVWPYSAGTLGSAITLDVSPSREVQENAMEWDSSGSYFVVGFQENGSAPELVIYNFNGSSIIQDVTAEIGQKVSSVGWSKVHGYILVGLSGGSERLRIYEHVAGVSLLEKTSARIGESMSVKAVDWSPDGKQIVIGLDNGSGTEFRIYDFDSSTITLSLVAELDAVEEVQAVRWSSNGLYIARGDKNKTLGVYGTISGESGDFVCDDLKIVFNSDINLKKSFRAKGTCFIDGRGHVLNLVEENSGIVVDVGANLFLKDIVIKNVAGNNIRCLASDSTLSLRNVGFVLDQDFTFTKGKIDIVGDVKMTGTHVFAYQSDQASTIYSDATWYFDAGMTFSYDTSVNNLLIMQDSTAKLHLYETILYATVPGLQFTKGTIVIEGECPVFSDATIETDGIFFGDGVSVANNVTIKNLPESGFNAVSGVFVYKNV